MQLDLRPVALALLLVAPAAALPAVLAPTAPAPVQDDELPDKRDEVKELIGAFEDHTKEKGKEDTEAVAVLDQLLQEFEQSGPKDREAIVKALDKSFKLKRKEHEDGTKENRVAYAAAVCLGKMAPESVKPLAKASTGKPFKDDEVLWRRVVISLGQTGHEDAFDPLMDLIDHKKPIIEGAAIEALGNFRDLPQKQRKEAVNQILKTILPLKSTVDSDSEDQITRERYDTIGSPAITTLQKLTDENIRDFVEWQRWWNKNKNEDWDGDDD